MRLSRYTIALDMGAYGTLFHGASGCMDACTRPVFDALVSAADHATGLLDGTIASVDPHIIEGLVRRGHLTDVDDAAELSLFRQYAAILNEQNRRVERQSGYIMVLLSYACNCDCAYCFQRDIRGYLESARMVPETVDLLFNRLQAVLCPGVDPEKICYVLYGGEPLLPGNRDTVEHMVRRASECGSTLEAITNGYCLDSFADLLGSEPGKISRAQISFDCDPVLHDRTRLLKSGLPTFEKILNNTVHAVQRGVDVQIRAHMHRGGAASLMAFLELLKARGLMDAPNVHVCLSPIKHDFSRSGASAPLDACLTAQEQCRLAPSVGSTVSGYYKTLSRLADATTGRGPGVTSLCMRSKENCYLIDPLGGIYCCYEEAGRPEYRVATYNADRVIFLPYRRTVLSNTIACQDSDQISAISLVTGGGCAVTARRSTSSEYRTQLHQQHCDMVTAALRRVVEEAVAGTGWKGEPRVWRPINYVQDGDRSLKGLIERFSRLTGRGHE